MRAAIDATLPSLLLLFDICFYYAAARLLSP